MTKQTTATLAGLTIAMLGPMVVAMLGERFARPPAPLVAYLLGLAALVAVVAAVLLVVFRFERQSLRSLGVRPLAWSSVVWGLALALFFMYVFAPIAYWLLARLDLGGFEAGLARSAGLPVWYLSLAVLVGGIAEELLYRGYAVERLAALTGSYWVAGSVSVLVFGLAHVPMWGWGPAFSTVLSGAIATAFFVWRKDLVANIVAHVVTDLVGIVVVPWLASSGG